MKSNGFDNQGGSELHGVPSCEHSAWSTLPFGAPQDYLIEHKACHPRVGGTLRSLVYAGLLLLAGPRAKQRPAGPKAKRPAGPKAKHRPSGPKTKQRPAGPSAKQRPAGSKSRKGARAAVATTTRRPIKIEDPSRGPGRVDFRGTDKGFGLEGTPKPKIQRGPPPNKETSYAGRRCKSHSAFLTLCLAPLKKTS
jgi:hypothetical protein